MTGPATRLVGVLELASKYRYGLTSRGAPLYLFRPYDEDRPEYAVGCSTRDTVHNQIAVVEIAAAQVLPPPPPAKPRANLVRLIGPVGDRAAEEAGLLEHYCGTKTAAPSPPPPPDTRDDTTRVDLSAATGWRVFHVDPPGCRDVDDAIAWHPDTDRWAVTIADAAAAVPPDSPVDRAASAQGTSFYDLGGRAVRPMLPPAISEDAASLLPGQRRRGVSLIFPSPSAGAPPLWTLSWITVAESFTYDNFAASSVATSAGATAIDPHDWIADWMVRYNAAAATLLRTHGTGLLRTQSPADAAAVASWPPALRHLAAEAAAYAPATTDAPEHAGLGLPAYTHASSPLRRYADLVNQRAIKAIITGAAAAADPLPLLLADHLNARTRAARRWTRDLTFLAHVVPGRVQEVAVIWLSDGRVWIPDWKRVIRIRHEQPSPPPAPGSPGRIQIFCDPTQRNWRQRVLTAPA